MKDVHFIGRYNFSYDGIALAAAELSIDEEKDTYAMHLVLVSKGVVNLFTRHRSDTTVEGKRASDHYYPRIYESHYWTKDKPRHIKLVFNAKGVITEETVEPPEDRKERPEVPHAFKDGAIDPLTVLRAIAPGKTLPHVFDAKHLWQGNVQPLISDEQVSILGRQVEGYSLSRVPLAGMTEKETRAFSKGEPQLNLYLEHGDRHVPIYIGLYIYLGHLVGALNKECTTWDECKVN